jgi:RNA recognition motif-containing protein
MDYFSQYGSISSTDVKMDSVTGRSRGFGFVEFVDPMSTDHVVQNASAHHIRDKWVDVKVYDRASANKGKDKGGGKGKGKGGPPPPYQAYQPAPQYQPPPQQHYGAPAGAAGGAKAQTLFIGGLPGTITQQDFEAYFSAYGPIASAEVKMDPQTGKPRGFGFIEYVDPESVRECLANATAHTIHEKWIDVKVYNSKGGGGKGGPKGGKGPPMPAYSPYGGGGAPGPYAAYGGRAPQPAYGAAANVYQQYGRAPMRPY